MRSTVEDVMTRDVVCAHEDTPFKELVKLLAGRRVSALPVVDGRRHVLGVVSEADLLLKQEKAARPAFWPLLPTRSRFVAEEDAAAEGADFVPRAQIIPLERAARGRFCGRIPGIF